MADPTALYSYKGASPTTLPHIIRPGTGVVRSDVSSFTDEEITDAGFTGPYTVPSHNSETQRVTWDSSNLAYVVSDISDEELWRGIREKRDLLLTQSDWTMFPDAPTSLNFDQWETYRQALRDLPSKFSNPKEVTWPDTPDNSGGSEFKLTERVKLYTTRVDALNGSINQVANAVGIATTSLGE